MRGFIGEVAIKEKSMHSKYIRSSKKKLQFGILIIITLLICGCTKGKKQESLEIIDINKNTIKQVEPKANRENMKAPQIDDVKEQYIAVYICGAISKPGVYELVEGSRIHQLLEKAGGMTESAAVTYLNQAQILVDGEKIYVPTQDEIELGKLPNTGGEGNESQKININTADMENLMQIPGVGEAKAQSIIEYRTEKGPFRKIEDIQNIPGIKEGVFQKIKDEIDVK